MRGKDALDGRERKIEEMLMINRVELHAGDEPDEVRTFDGQYAVFSQKLAQARHEIIDRRHMRKHIVGGNEIGRSTLRNDALGRFLAKENRFGGYACRARDFRYVGGWLDPETGDAARHA